MFHLFCFEGEINALAFCFGVICENRMASIEEFIKAPSEEKLNSFVKQQLWDLVEHFKIGEVDKKTRKKELRSVIKNWLCRNSLMVVSPQGKSDSDAKGSFDYFFRVVF